MRVVAGVPVLFAGLLVSWLLARPDGPDPVALPATLALGVSVVVLGLGLLPTVDAEPSSTWIGALAGVWVVATLISAWVRTADRSGKDVLDVTAGDFGEVLASGASEMVALAVGLLIVVWAVVDLLTAVEIPVLVVGALAAIGVLATAIAGHAGNNAFGPFLVGAHALAAAWWCGLLAAMVLSVRGRSGWACSLPVFSQRAPWAVGVIAVTGVVAGLTEIDGLSPLITSGYGRILLAKVVMLAALVGVAAWHRRRWVPAVERHRQTEAASIRNAAVELALMAAVLGLAAGLSATAP
ncbi:copper resistance D family protein [Gordonia rubripertincta]|uniref:CopD family protein n=1 Tax=Gordonia rubripertincta TaxID=36822 RepID=A0AAW4G3G5_GORRU|nr:CopD family protein [Gordonia rubripertincta]ASR01934.1 Copper resistance protein D [Gordonia rubripertincta]MBM7277691.1 CopD family protein [Gordonia rubripertincta]QMU22854.1 CopD family protein [Gordonia rubripertincta]